MIKNDQVVFPMDMELRTQYRKLESLCGSKRVAKSIIQELFIDLAYQTRQHGHTGWFDAEESGVFMSQIGDMVEPPVNAITWLLQSKMLVADGENWFCPIFAECNQHLDFGYVSEDRPVRRQFAKIKVGHEERFEKASELLNPECRNVPGELATQIELRNAIVAISILDEVCRSNPRAMSDYPPGLVQSVIQEYRLRGDRKMSIILRFLFIKRQRLKEGDARFREAEMVVRELPQILLDYMPTEGFVAWDKSGDESPAPPEPIQPAGSLTGVQHEEDKE